MATEYAHKDDVWIYGATRGLQSDHYDGLLNAGYLIAHW
jgi:hypothetical protein